MLVPLGIALAIRLVPEEVMAECREQARTAAERPTSRWAALVIVVACVIMALLVGFWAMDTLDG